MASTHVTGTARALYRVFVFAPLSPSPFKATRRSLPSHPHPTNRAFSKTSSRCKVVRPPEVRQQKWNDEIESEWVHLVDEQRRLQGRPHRLRDILASIDRKETRVVQLSSDTDDTPDGLPICLIRHIREMFEEEQRNKLRQKEHRKESKLKTAPKSLELNWAIDQHDLAHRMGKMKSFLAEGRRVEIILAAKKKGRKASIEECDALLRRIRADAESVPGTTFMGEMEGKLGAMSTLRIQGKAPEPEKEAQKEAREETQKDA